MSQTGRRLAILIGSSKFDKEPLKARPLKCPERDVDGMRELLASAEFGVFGEVFVFKNSYHQAALDQIEEVLTAAARDDQVLIYYSGHGETDLPGRLYLTASNTDTKKLVATSIPIDTLRTMIENSSCRKIILILDCCFGGAVGKSFVKGSVDEKLKELARGYGIYILTASTASQTALEDDDHGLLTKHIITGIKEGVATNKDGVISIDGLYRYVYAKVTGEGYQEPMRWALNVKGEDLIIARAAAVYSAERLQAFRKLINELDTNEEIDEEIADQARRVIRANQPKRDKKLLELLDQLQKGEKSPGPFSSQWMKAFVALSSGDQISEDRPTKQTEGGTTNAPVPKPLEGKATNTPETKPPEGGATKALAPKRSITMELQGSAAGFTDDLNGVKLEMVYVAKGKFTMGSNVDDSEKPPHEVTVPAFYIGKFQITQAQWKAVMGEKLKPGFKGDSLPMESVSWEDAKEFCSKLAQLNNKAYRLPSEAEWEYACRAGTTTEFAFGDSLSSEQANFNGDYPYGSAKKSIYREKTTPVGSFDPNAFGPYDMHGNVWEWCEDVWHGDYKESPIDGSAWLNDGDSTYRIVRGGSWYNNGSRCRSAVRYHYPPGARFRFIGFRVVVAARSS